MDLLGKDSIYSKTTFNTAGSRNSFAENKKRLQQTLQPLMNTKQ